jgi:hypothetical protein
VGTNDAGDALMTDSEPDVSDDDASNSQGGEIECNDVHDLPFKNELKSWRLVNVIKMEYLPGEPIKYISKFTSGSKDQESKYFRATLQELRKVNRSTFTEQLLCDRAMECDQEYARSTQVKFERSGKKKKRKLQQEVTSSTRKKRRGKQEQTVEEQDAATAALIAQMMANGEISAYPDEAAKSYDGLEAEWQPPKSHNFGRDNTVEHHSLKHMHGCFWCSYCGSSFTRIDNYRGKHLVRSKTCPGTVRAFRQKFPLEDVIGSHACSLEALTCV